jgi:hypothetical protein
MREAETDVKEVASGLVHVHGGVDGAEGMGEVGWGVGGRGGRQQQRSPHLDNHGRQLVHLHPLNAQRTHGARGASAAEGVRQLLDHDVVVVVVLHAWGGEHTRGRA